MCILHIVFCTVCKYVLSICKLLLFFCAVWSTLLRISLTKALVLWWCDNKSDLIFDLIWGSTSSFSFKATNSISEYLGSYPKSGNYLLNYSYKTLSVRHFELKPHIHTLGTSETYLKKEHNRSSLKGSSQRCHR